MPASPPPPAKALRREEFEVASRRLGRRVRVTALLPPRYRLNVLARYPLLIVNDGQDFDRLELERRLRSAYRAREVQPRVVIGVHADERRMREYGTSREPDYAGRGDLADAYRRFVVEELLPLLLGRYRLRGGRDHRAIGGVSLGGLSAFDIAWWHELKFGAVGCFSASFWWRSSPPDPAHPDADRIVVERVRHAVRAADLQYYFMVGTEEEASDRNGNGIIDVIDDTLDVIAALRDRGVRSRSLRYDCVDGGRHEPATWGPELIRWLSWLDRPH